jgi:hypothetical protein
VALQLDGLRRCRSPYQVEQQLLCLPKDLNETYDRIICRIDEKDHQDAHKVLQWLAFSIRPLKLAEVAEVVAVVFEPPNLPWFDCTRRYYNAEDILGLCSGFISCTEGRNDTNCMRTSVFAH